MNIHFGVYFLINIFVLSVVLLSSCKNRSLTETLPETSPASSPSPTSEIASIFEKRIPRPLLDPEDRPLFSILGWKTDFRKHSVPYAEIIDGGVPRDGIPPIYEPKFENITQASSWLTERDPVVSLELGGESRAYPLNILIWHEIVNDIVKGIPVAITYCPLCNTAIVFDRRLEGNVLTFGVSGLLRYSDLVMWDHQTESLWQQATGEGIVGVHTGKLLDFFPSSIVSWKDFMAANPEGRVLSSDTGFRRNYGANPYKGYDTSRSPFLFSGQPDPRLPAMERVVGISRGEKAVAYPFSVLAKLGVVHDKVNGQRLVLFYQSGAASALDKARISESRDVGAAAVFLTEVEGKELHFEIKDGSITDKETGSQWNILGHSIQGPLAGKKLKPAVHGTHLWFAWAAFNPQTRIYSP